MGALARVAGLCHLARRPAPTLFRTFFVQASPMQPTKGPMIAIAWMMGALVSFLVMAVSVRELGAEMHA